MAGVLAVAPQTWCGWCGLRVCKIIHVVGYHCGSIDYDMYSIRRASYNCTGLFKAGGYDAKHTRYILTADTCIYI